ncbi:hypothetical protein QEN19_001119 [Hanseniaspora menglaensis]
MTVHCKIIKTSENYTGKFTLYYVSLFKRTEEEDVLINKQPLMKRYTDFLNFKENLEARFKCQVPYVFPAKNGTSESKQTTTTSSISWFNPVALLSNNLSTDTNIVNYRKTMLEQFLNDILSDSFDDKWKKSIITSNFLEIDKNLIVEQPTTMNMFKGSNKLADAYNGIDDKDEKSSGEIDWWVVYRTLSELLHKTADNENDKESNLKELMSARLMLQQLESNLHSTTKHRDLKKREVNLKKIKQELYDLSTKLSAKAVSNDTNHVNSTIPLMSSSSSVSISSLRATPGRTLGSKKQILNEQKVELKSQEKEIEDLHSTILMQKNLGININKELRSQMELMDSMGDDLSDTTRKMNRAHNKAKKYNNSS